MTFCPTKSTERAAVLQWSIPAAPCRSRRGQSSPSLLAWPSCAWWSRSPWWTPILPAVKAISELPWVQKRKHIWNGQMRGREAQSLKCLESISFSLSPLGLLFRVTRVSSKSTLTTSAASHYHNIRPLYTN